MKIKRKNEKQAIVSFKDLGYGACFQMPDINSGILMKVCVIDSAYDYYNTVNLETGILFSHDDSDECIPLPFAKIVVDFSKMEGLKKKLAKRRKTKND